jgi:hypothetical protein
VVPTARKKSSAAGEKQTYARNLLGARIGQGVGNGNGKAFCISKVANWSNANICSRAIAYDGCDLQEITTNYIYIDREECKIICFLRHPLLHNFMDSLNDEYKYALKWKIHDTLSRLGSSENTFTQVY